MFAAVVFMFCRITIVLLFLFSSASKALDLRDFVVTIGDFKLLPRRWSKTAAWLFLGSEITAAVLILLGGNVLSLGFLLATALLVTFSLALGMALRRNISMSCNCFGRTERRISYYDLARNGVLILCTVLGLCLCNTAPQNLAISEIIVLVLMSVVFLLFVMNLREIVAALRHPFPVFEERR